MENKIAGYCAECDDPIYEEDERYEFPDGDMIHLDCLYDWAEQYHRLGAIDLA